MLCVKPESTVLGMKIAIFDECAVREFLQHVKLLRKYI